MVCVSVWEDIPQALESEKLPVQTKKQTLLAYCTSMHFRFMHCEIFDVKYCNLMKCAINFLILIHFRNRFPHCTFERCSNVFHQISWNVNNTHTHGCWCNKKLLYGCEHGEYVQEIIHSPSSLIIFLYIRKFQVSSLFDTLRLYKYNNMRS